MMDLKDDAADRCRKCSHHFKVLVAGQCLSFFAVCISGAASLLQTKCAVNRPTVQVCFMYVSLFPLVFWLRRRSSSGEHSIDIISSEENPVYRLPCTSIQLHAPWYFYATLAWVDLEANYFTFRSFRYTGVSNAALFSTLSVPSTMVFSCLLLQRRYGVVQCGGALLCVLGFCLAAISDVTGNTEPTSIHFPHAVRGDILVMLGATLYGLSDVLCERTVKNSSVLEYLAMLGLFGFLISFIQILWLEHDFFGALFYPSSSSLQITCRPSTSVLLLSFNALSQCAYYVSASHFLRRYEAALMEVSLLTSNLYAAGFVIVYQGYAYLPAPTFWLAILVVIAGVLVYESGRLQRISLGVGEELREAHNITTITPRPQEEGFLDAEDFETTPFELS